MTRFRFSFIVLFVALCSHTCFASYAYYVGKDLTEDGQVLVGGTGEEVSSHWLEIVPAQDHPSGAMITVGATAEALMPGRLTEIPQASETFRFLTMNYTDFRGMPPPLTNGGLNEHGLAVRDVWSPSRQELVEMTPNPQTGPQYSDLARIALQRARTAREAVEILGSLIDEHGYTTYGGNSHLFADADEGWIMLEFAGGQGLWVAERLGAKDVRALYPGYIEEIPLNYQVNPDYMGSKNLISFAVEQGWFDEKSGGPFKVYEIYSLGQGTARSPELKFVDPATIEAELMAKAPRITLEDMMDLVRDPRIADDQAGYGQVVQLSKKHTEPGLQMIWVAPTTSVTAPFLPWYLGCQEVPPEFAQHRYLTRDSGSTFLNPDYQAQEATMFAGRVFKRLLYLVAENPEMFLEETTETLKGFEAQLMDEQTVVEQTASELYRAGRRDLAESYLTLYCQTRALEGLRLGEALVAGTEARTRVVTGIRKPTSGQINLPKGQESVNVLVDIDPDRPASQQR